MACPNTICPPLRPAWGKARENYAAEAETDTFLLSAAGRWPEAASPLSFCPCEPQPSGAKRHKYAGDQAKTAHCVQCAVCMQRLAADSDE